MAFKKPSKAAPVAPLENGNVAIMAPVDLTISTFNMEKADWEAIPVKCKAALQEAAGVLTEKRLTNLYLISYSGNTPIMGLVAAANLEAAANMFNCTHMEEGDVEECDCDLNIYVVPADALHNHKTGRVPWGTV